MSEERPCAAAPPRRIADCGFPENPPDGISGREKSGSERHSKDGNALAKLDTAIGLRFCDFSEVEESSQIMATPSHSLSLWTER